MVKDDQDDEIERFRVCAIFIGFRDYDILPALIVSLCPRRPTSA
jgi:hypothetical protein